MDLTVRGRGVRITEQMRTKAAHKLGRLSRRTLRASASAEDLDAALDQLLERLERQVRDYRAKRKKRLLPRANPLKSPRTGPKGRGEGA